MYRSTKKYIRLLFYPLVPFVVLIGVQKLFGNDLLYSLGWLWFLIIPVLLFLFIGISFWYVIITMAYFVDKENEKAQGNSE